MSEFVMFSINSELQSCQRLGFDTFTHQTWQRGLKDKVVVRWANSRLMPDKYGNRIEFPNVINTSIAIKANKDKNQASLKMSEVVRIPTIFNGEIPSKRNAVFRPRLHASAGADFRVVTGPMSIPDDYYAVEFVKARAEYRTFFCGDDILCVERVSEDKARLGEKFPCKSNWPYRRVSGIKGSKLEEQTFKVAKKLNFEFGCCDVLEKDGEYYFLETNTGATLGSPLIVDFYKTNLIKLVEQKFG